MQGSNGAELWPSVCTEYTDVYSNGVKGKSKVQTGATMLRPYSHHQADRRNMAHSTDDIDPELLKRLYRHRYVKIQCVVLFVLVDTGTGQH